MNEQMKDKREERRDQIFSPVVCSVSVTVPKTEQVCNKYCQMNDNWGIHLSYSPLDPQNFLPCLAYSRYLINVHLINAWWDGWIDKKVNYRPNYLLGMG